MTLVSLAVRLEDAEPGDARSVLALLVGKAQAVSTPPPEPQWDAGGCPNCGGEAFSTRTPYCGGPCRQEAAFVRQFRTALVEDTLHDTDRQTRLGQALWHLLGGGYPHRLPLILPSTAKQALKRTDGRCEGCGQPASTFDHLGSG